MLCKKEKIEADDRYILFYLEMWKLISNLFLKVPEELVVTPLAVDIVVKPYML